MLYSKKATQQIGQVHKRQKGYKSIVETRIIRFNMISVINQDPMGHHRLE